MPFTSPLLTFDVYLLGSTSFAALVVALFSYQPPVLKNLEESTRVYRSPMFNPELQNSEIMRKNATSPSVFWYVFIGMQLGVALMASMVCFVGYLYKGLIPVRMISTLLCMIAFTVACATTHSLGGKWRHIATNYKIFQPGQGGTVFIALQTIGWVSFGCSIVSGFVTLTALAQVLAKVEPISLMGLEPTENMAVCGFLGLVGEVLIILSLFAFKDTDGKVVKGFRKMVEQEETGVFNDALSLLIKIQFKLLKAIFAPNEDL